MKKLILVLSLAAGALVAGSAPAGAAGSFCYDVNVTAAGQSLVAQTGCQELP